MTYTPPVAHILLAMQAVGRPDTSGLSREDAEAILNEAARFAAHRLAPLNRIGDLNPARLVDGAVVMPPEWGEIYDEWRAGGWNGIAGPEEFGGQGLPFMMSAACGELWNAACMSFGLCPLLTTGAIEAIAAHASDMLKQQYLPQMIAGEWAGTMNLTEPQAGSDLSQIQCKARRHGDGSHRITGNKIYITWGEHSLTSNIIHLVLARLEDAPAGTKGISLFLVPKILPDGTANDVRCHSLESKLGIHGSPTCAMVYGDKGGATGWLVGAENRGLACMFTMMNNARVLVGVQGVALAERAMQAAFAFAATRQQGRADGASGQSPINRHPDVQRMLLDMRAKTAAARLLCMATAAAIDAGDGNGAALLTPLAKTYATDIAVEVTSTAIQVHGGMGYIEDTGVAQFHRDARILPIYEGTNGMQAIDLVTRKLALDNGRTLADAVLEGEAALSVLVGHDVAAAFATDMRALTEELLRGDRAVLLGAATPFTRALAAFVGAGFLARATILARGGALQAEADTNARHFTAVELPTALAVARAAVAGAHILKDVDWAQ